MVTRVVVVYEDDSGRVVWGYEHSETVTYTGDPEQMALVAAGQLAEHVDKARDSVLAQARVEVDNIPDDL